MMQRAAELRKTPTPAEARLWNVLRGDQIEGVSFRRQHAIEKHIVDFCSPKRRLIIEVDGGAYAAAARHDDDRTAELVSEGYRVLRFWNAQVLNDTDTVVKEIIAALRSL